MISPERFAQVRALYHAVVDLEAGERRLRLEKATESDPELRTLVEEILAFDTGHLDAHPGIDAVLAVEPSPAELASLAPGDLLSDRYRIRALIGHGGMGEVYRATDEALGTEVALKLVRPEVARDTASLRRLKREVLAARSVTHLNVCRVYDFAHDDERNLSYLTMELLSGETLSGHLARHGSFSPSVALELLTQLADALDAAHAANVVHRDLKSANIMLVPTEDGRTRAVITDFGLATSISTGTDLDDPRAGTPAYMAPEQVEGGMAYPASDLYALGVVIYEMITGRRPFSGATPLAVAHARLSASPVPPSTWSPVDEAWDQVTLRLLAREPEARFACASDAVRALTRVQVEHPQTRSQLPDETNPFVGRTVELRQIAELLEFRGLAKESTRVVTLLGPFGVGKTRLANHYAQLRIALWPGGAFWCELRDAVTQQDVVRSIASTLDAGAGDLESAESLGNWLAGRGRCLLILDNAEAVVRELAPMLERWLQAAPDVRVLVTSRERLRVSAEAALDVEPMDEEGVELFAIRARAARPDFVVNEATQPIVAQIVETLDGLPLAIELAAARMRILGVEQLRDRLRDRFRLLTGGPRGRHETLQATLDWSWDLLPAVEKSTLTQLSVFRGGFWLEGAEAVVDLTSHQDPPLVLEVLQSLVDKSWLGLRVEAGEPRFRLYMSVQAYTADRRWRPAPNEGAPNDYAVELRHARHYASQVRDDAWLGLDRLGRRLVVDLPNVILACEWSCRHRHGALASRTYALAAAIIRRHGPVGDNLALADRVLAIPALEAIHRARTLRYLSLVQHRSGRHDDAIGTSKSALSHFRELGNKREECAALLDLASFLSRGKNPGEARQYYAAALSAADDADDPTSEVYALYGLATYEVFRGRTDAAVEHYSRALARLREHENPRVNGLVHLGLGTVRFRGGQMGEARRHFEVSLQELRLAGDRRSEVSALSSLGSVYMQAGRVAQARDAFERAVEVSRELGSRPNLAHNLVTLGEVFAVQGDLDAADRHLGEALLVARAVQDTRGEALALGLSGTVAQLRGFDEDATSCQERALALYQAVDRRDEALALGLLGDTHRIARRLAKARDCYREGLSICEETSNLTPAGSIWVGLGAIDRDEGRLAESREKIQRGIEMLRECGGRHELGIAYCELGALLVAEGDIVEASRAAESATDLARSLAVRAQSALGRSIRELRKLLEER
ncbi:MAG: tetratricopeptide repeat protein [Candidatus Eisenbacteria bacterium]